MWVALKLNYIEKNKQNAMIVAAMIEKERKQAAEQGIRMTPAHVRTTYMSSMMNNLHEDPAYRQEEHVTARLEVYADGQLPYLTLHSTLPCSDDQHYRGISIIGEYGSNIISCTQANLCRLSAIAKQPYLASN